MSEPARFACMAVELNELEKRAAEEAKPGGFVPYAGSVKGHYCRECGREIWVGPK